MHKCMKIKNIYCISFIISTITFKSEYMDHIEWGSLPFGYQKTNFNVRSYYREGEWGKLETTDSEYISVHMAATGLHYGQEAFEGLKAYMGKDGKIRLFRWEENAN